MQPQSSLEHSVQQVRDLLAGGTCRTGTAPSSALHTELQRLSMLAMGRDVEPSEVEQVCLGREVGLLTLLDQYGLAYLRRPGLI